MDISFENLYVDIGVKRVNHVSFKLFVSLSLKIPRG